jgi:hypothetical protein
MKTIVPLLFAATFLLVFGGTLIAQTDNSNSNPNSGSWSGVIMNNNCNADEAFNEVAKCTEKDVPGAKLMLYDDTTRQFYALDPQDLAQGHLGDSMTAAGTLEGTILHLTSLKMHTAIGLAVGAMAPAFSARDQFGNLQSLETLKGPKGTVLLFFRSADW